MTTTPPRTAGDVTSVLAVHQPLPIGVERYAEPACWILVYPTGEHVDTGDSCPHYDTAEEAAGEAARLAVPTLGGVPAPQPLTGPCYVAKARCGAVHDEDGTAAFHFPTPGEAHRAALESGWKADNGQLICEPDCIRGCIEETDNDR